MRKKVKVGVAFSDFVEHDSFSFYNKKPRSSFQSFSIFALVPAFLLICLFLILLLRLFYVQVVQGSYYKGLSDDNRTRTSVIPAPRGIIFDRNGKPLVRNVPVFETLDHNGHAKIITRDMALTLLNQGKQVFDTVSRNYLYNSAFAHVLGYTGQISENQINQPEFADYTISDFVGKMGLEAQYESLLHGKNGKTLFEVNAQGLKTRQLGSQDPVPGVNINTTLDVNVQMAAQTAMKDVKKGAVVVSDPRDGAILGLYSKPSFDTNIFTHAASYVPVGDYKSITSVLMDTDNQPLLDRTISGAYPPGSTFKLVTAAAALSTGAIKPDTLFDDTGMLKVGGSSFGNWYFLQYGRTEGNINVVTAIKRSNDIFFYHAADVTGVDTISNWARKLGAGHTLGIDLPGEVSGTVPTEEWKKKQVGEQWYTGDTFNYGIGQGYLLTTPLQVNSWTDVFANGGTLYQPHLLIGQVKKLRENVVKKEYVDLIRIGMNEACSTGGVAWPLFNFEVRNSKLPIDNLDYTLDASASGLLTSSNSASLHPQDNAVRIQLGCKTGTAEVGGKDTNPEAWITVFAPFHNPEVSVTVLVENGGEGSSVAGPIARDILKSYFEHK